MPKHYVVIYEGDPLSGKLKMDGEEILVFSNRGKEHRKVEWLIENIWEQDDPRYVQYFKIVGPDPHPFEEDDAPPKEFRGGVKCKIKKGESQKEWKYTIDWKSKIAPGDIHHFDPKISVNPIPLFDTATLFAGEKKSNLKIAFFLLALLGLGILAKKSGRLKNR